MPTPRDTFGLPPVAIGVITPSGNNVVERVTIAIGRELPGVSQHFSRTPVFGDGDPHPSSYDWEGMLGAARLLAHVDPAVIVWNGSKAASIDLALDRELVRRIRAETGRPATTSILAMDEILRADGVRRVAVLTPYGAAYGAKVERTLAAAGYACVSVEHAGLADNLSFSRIPLDEIAAMARRVAVARPEAILAVCTNFPAAAVAAELERELGIPVYDTVALGVWAGMRAVGVDTRPARAWGRLFERP
jgi:maleate isomerase